MKIKIFFLISAMNSLSYLCCGNCCENCYGDCWENCVGKENEKKNEDENGKSEEKKNDEKEKSEEKEKKDENEKKGGENEEKWKIEEQIFLEEEKGQEEEAKIFVNKAWLEKKNPNLKLYKKTESGGDEKIKVTKYTNGEIKVENFNPKENTQKWALFEIVYKEEEKGEKTVYLYCSDIESTGEGLYKYGIFDGEENILSISVLACDTSKVNKMYYMFSSCSNLKNLNLSKFDTSCVTNMGFMFLYCNNLNKVIVSKDENTKNEILKRLSLVGKWKESEDDDKFVLTKNQN